MIESLGSPKRKRLSSVRKSFGFGFINPKDIDLNVSSIENHSDEAASQPDLSAPSEMTSNSSVHGSQDNELDLPFHRMSLSQDSGLSTTALRFALSELKVRSID
jgi:hypothetical protein